ncbi:MAG: class I mannose-6-phosphate isomerase, partial [Anaerotignum sp.]
THEGQLGKTELWYVVDALPGARLVCGFEHDMTPALLRRAIADGTLQKHLHSVEVHPGDVFFIPPGTVHAIGEGCLIAEIQESSNVTYRLYDYDRRDKDGNPRPLHVDKASEVLHLKRGFQEKQPPRFIRYRPGCSHEIVGRCAHFQVERLQVSDACRLFGSRESFQVLLCIRGEGELRWHGGEVRLRPGSCVFVPAAGEDLLLEGRAELLLIRC